MRMMEHEAIDYHPHVFHSQENDAITLILSDAGVITGAVS